MRIRVQGLALSFVGLLALPVRAAPADPPERAPAIDVRELDPSVRPQDDFDRFVNGKWADRTQIPGDKSRVSSFDKLHDQAEANVRTIVDEIGARTGTLPPDHQKIRDLYRSYMAEQRLDALGLMPIEDELRRIGTIKDLRAVVERFAEGGRDGIDGPLGLGVGADARNPRANLLGLGQAGLGLPDRDDYFDQTPRGKEVRQAYGRYVAALLRLSGQADAEPRAKRILALEEKLAALHWTNVQNRDPQKTYNPMTRAELRAIHPLIDHFIVASGGGAADRVDVAQPTYLTGLAKLLDEVPLEDWKLYLHYKTVAHYAAHLGKDLRDASFEFRGKVLGGLTQRRERWRGAIGLLDDVLGEAVGKEYVARHFDPAAKQKMDVLVANIRKAMDETIGQIKWMDPKTKAAARQKLAQITTKIGYPDKWRDYAKLEIKSDDLVGNLRRAARFGHDEAMGKIGRPVDRAEWHMTPQTVNAYYSPVGNEIVFPAAILQPPFFDAHADDAVNYGAIGAVIGHELSHGFDDSGARFDGDGAMRDWWTARDMDEFGRRADALAKKFDAFEPVPGTHINGKLTTGENIADALGAQVAYRAYQLSLGNRQPRKIDGYTGKQRFFLAFAQIWRGKSRAEHLQNQLRTDPHSPQRFRILGTLGDSNAFHRVWQTKKAQGAMYTAPRQRVHVW